VVDGLRAVMTSKRSSSGRGERVEPAELDVDLLRGGGSAGLLDVGGLECRCR